MKNNIITYAYRGFFAFIYLIIGKRKKIREMFIIDDENAINMDANDVFAKNRTSSFKESNNEVKNAELMDKLRFKYKATNTNIVVDIATMIPNNIPSPNVYAASNVIPI